MNGRERAAYKRTKSNVDFPYKNVVLCPECDKPFMGSATKGKLGKKHPAYHCARKHKRVGLNKKEFDEIVENYINQIEFVPEYFDTFKKVMIDIYRQKEGEVLNTSISIGEQVTELKYKKKQLAEDFLGTKNENIRSIIEEKIDQLQKQIESLEDIRNESEIEERDIHGYLAYAKNIMEHPGQILLKPRNIHEQQTLWSLVFEKYPTIEELRNGTPQLTFIFKAKSTFESASASIVGDEGLEPPTFPV